MGKSSTKEVSFVNFDFFSYLFGFSEHIISVKLS